MTPLTLAEQKRLFEVFGELSRAVLNVEEFVGILNENAADDQLGDHIRRVLQGIAKTLSDASRLGDAA